jgi:hypothetical protein
MTPVAALAIFLALQGGEQFDLVCVGDETSGGDYLPLTSQPSNSRLRVDLRGGVWCVNDCYHVSEFARVGPTELVLEESGPDTLAVRRVINRTNGHHLVEIRTNLNGIKGWTMVSEHCERAQFTPIPAAQF